ncbi:hypothetical protein B0H14DRAFT_3049493, partial [Mycena olivaceomarginata]
VPVTSLRKKPSRGLRSGLQILVVLRTACALQTCFCRCSQRQRQCFGRKPVQPIGRDAENVPTPHPPYPLPSPARR